MDEYEKLELLFNRMLDKTLVEVYIDDSDAFIMEFDDGTLVELFSDDGDLGIYFEIGQKEEPTIQ